MATRQRYVAFIAVLAFLSACTLKKQETPSLTGPSELGTSVRLSVSPDVLYLDGASQSIVTIQTFDANGQPMRNVSLRAEIFLNGTLVDFGTLSARNVVSDANGRASVVYTAPASGTNVDTFTTVQILVTPAGTDFANATARSVSIRLVPVGIVVPPDGLKPSFTMSNGSPTDHEPVLFTACADATNPCAPANNPIAQFSWDFGDGDHATGSTATHAFDDPGTFVVTLTITDEWGRSASSVRTMTVGAGAKPTASFVFSPTPAPLNQPVHFNASGSTAPAGRRIVTYSWDFGDGVQQSSASATIDHTYTVGNRTYVVTLTVTDDAGKVSLPSTQPITPE
jgi:PKD repeat protein